MVSLTLIITGCAKDLGGSKLEGFANVIKAAGDVSPYSPDACCVELQLPFTRTRRRNDGQDRGQAVVAADVGVAARARGRIVAAALLHYAQGALGGTGERDVGVLEEEVVFDADLGCTLAEGMVVVGLEREGIGLGGAEAVSVGRDCQVQDIDRVDRARSVANRPTSAG